MLLGMRWSPDLREASWRSVTGCRAVGLLSMGNHSISAIKASKLKLVKFKHEVSQGAESILQNCGLTVPVLNQIPNLILWPHKARLQEPLMENQERQRRRLGASLLPPHRVWGTQASASPPCSVEGSSFGSIPGVGSEVEPGAGMSCKNLSPPTYRAWTKPHQAGVGTSAGHICRGHHLKKPETANPWSCLPSWPGPIPLLILPPHTPKLCHHRHLLAPRLPPAVSIDQFHISPPCTSFLLCLSHTNPHLPQVYPEMRFNHWLHTSLCSIYLHLSDLWSELITMNYLPPCTLWALWTYFTCSSLPWIHSFRQPCSPIDNKTILL